MHAAIRLLVLLAVVASACGPTVDVTKGLEVLDLRTGWHDAGQVDGQNKLVPSISFRLKNISDQRLKVLHANAVFRQVGNHEEWGTGFKIVRGSQGLDSGETTDIITLTSLQGYKAPQPRADMLANQHFVDAKVNLFAKYSSIPWKQIGEYTIERQLITD